jgi:hypothetical protein
MVMMTPMFLSDFNLEKNLGIVGPVKVLPRDAALAPRHVAADDKVSAPIIFADEHVLDGLRIHQCNKQCRCISSGRGVNQVEGR